MFGVASFARSPLAARSGLRLYPKFRPLRSPGFPVTRSSVGTACSRPPARKGYSGVAVLCKQPPLSVVEGIGSHDADLEGRVITVVR